MYVETEPEVVYETVYVAESEKVYVAESEKVTEKSVTDKSSTGAIVGSVIGVIAFVCCAGGIMIVLVAVVIMGCLGVSVSGVSIATLLFGGSGIVGVAASGSGIGILCCRFCKKRG